MPNIRDTFALPRDTATPDHVREGAWEGKNVDWKDVPEHLLNGWHLPYIYPLVASEGGVLLERTQSERCSCQREGCDWYKRHETWYVDYRHPEQQGSE